MTLLLFLTIIVFIFLIIAFILYAWIKKSYKGQPTGLAKVQFTIAFIALIALFASTMNIYLDVYPPIKKPNLAIETALPKVIVPSKSFNVYLYNGGEAPCFDLKLITPPNLITSTYLNQEHSRSKYEFRGNNTYLTKSPIIQLIPYYHNEELFYYGLDFIKENEIMSFSISAKNFKEEDIEIRAECEGSEASAKIKLSQ